MRIILFRDSGARDCHVNHSQHVELLLMLLTVTVTVNFIREEFATTNEATFFETVNTMPIKPSCSKKCKNHLQCKINVSCVQLHEQSDTNVGADRGAGEGWTGPPEGVVPWDSQRCGRPAKPFAVA